MAGLFYNLGRKVGPAVRKGKWLLKSLTGSEGDVIRAEREVGRDIARSLMDEVSPDDTPQTVEILNDVGPRLAERLTNREREFSFRGMLTPDVNAHALPGGFIFVTRGLLELCGWDRDAAAFILGHEMAHVVKGHAMDQILNRTAMSVASRTPMAVGVLRHRMAEIGLHLIHQAYAQDQELEADRFAARLARSGGFDPRAGLTVLGLLEQSSRRHQEPEIFTYLSSHPPVELRKAELKRFLLHHGYH
jgi:predicted Zn-dependent protease